MSSIGPLICGRVEYGTRVPACFGRVRYFCSSARRSASARLPTCFRSFSSCCSWSEDTSAKTLRIAAACFLKTATVSSLPAVEAVNSDTDRPRTEVHLWSDRIHREKSLMKEHLQNPGNRNRPNLLAVFPRGCIAQWLGGPCSLQAKHERRAMIALSWKSILKPNASITHQR
jgi:hypothetical protein